MSDCSPLLNGCSRVNELYREAHREAQRWIDANDTFELECILVEHSHENGTDGNEWFSQWQNVSDEGIETLIVFRYPGVTGVEEKVGDKIVVTIHQDEHGNTINPHQPLRVS
jgi:hypothetical protein